MGGVHAFLYDVRILCVRELCVCLFVIECVCMYVCGMCGVHVGACSVCVGVVCLIFIYVRGCLSANVCGSVPACVTFVCGFVYSVLCVYVCVFWVCGHGVCGVCKGVALADSHLERLEQDSFRVFAC